MNGRIRSTIFWLHLIVGLAAGLVVLAMSVTGVLLMYERQITEWADRGYRAEPAPGAVRLPVEALLAKAAEAVPDVSPSGITLQSDPAAPATVALGRGRNLYLNPYTGQALGEGAPKVRAFFRKITDWHRWLGAEDERRDTGRAVTGAANLGFLFLVLSGIYLWLPRTWTRRQVRNVAWFRGGLSGKARDFNWHNVIGLWMWAPLVLIVFSGVVISYPWAGNLVYRMVGEEPPARSGGGEGAARAQGGRGGEGERGRGGERGESSRGGRGPEGGPREPREAPSFDGLNELWAAAERRVPGWESVSLRIPGPDEPATFTIARGHRGRPDLRSQLALDRQSGEEVRWEPYSSQTLGRKARTWLRWIHTGEAGGFAGQTLAGLASAGAAVLVWTGVALSWRRFFPRRRAQAAVGKEGLGIEELSKTF